ncbi:hypothetical protein ACS0ZG_17270 [Burkholderia gladioli]|uniref:hypothetical protein n=1 Tax=Burkholderia gladioli TaxID=28095 RepID=UPI000649F7B5|nr:hypothetical protein [Burkholderia gladioli]MDA0573409.1 hypothetical protein [Burkholderia gladioli]MDA0601583.1 hypothetical protein [Burkholderia gladioli]
MSDDLGMHLVMVLAHAIDFEQGGIQVHALVADHLPVQGDLLQSRELRERVERRPVGGRGSMLKGARASISHDDVTGKGK